MVLANIDLKLAFDIVEEFGYSLFLYIPDARIQFVDLEAAGQGLIGRGAA